MVRPHDKAPPWGELSRQGLRGSLPSCIKTPSPAYAGAPPKGEPQQVCWFTRSRSRIFPVRVESSPEKRRCSPWSFGICTLGTAS